MADEKASKAAWAILAAMGFGALIAQMFSTVIGPALPPIKGDLALGLSAQTWTISAYSLAFGTALVAGGRMGDLVGEVKMIVIGFIIFGGGLIIVGDRCGRPLDDQRAGHPGNRHRNLRSRNVVDSGELVSDSPTRVRGRCVGVRPRIRPALRPAVRRLDDGDRQLALGVLGGCTPHGPSSSSSRWPRPAATRAS